MTTAVAARTDIVERQGTRTWLLATRAVAALDLFRIVAGVGLTIHFIQAFFRLSPWLDQGRLLPTGAMIGPLRHSAFDRGLTLYAPQAAFGAAIVLASMITLGALPRISAAVLYSLSVVTYWAIAPIATHDDYFAVLASFALMLLPVGRSFLSFPLRSRATRGQEPDVPVSAPAATVMLLCVIGLYLTGSMEGWNHLAGDEGRNINVAFKMAAVLLIIPAVQLQAAGVLLQALLHGYLMWKGQLIVVNAVLGGTAILFWGERTGRVPARSPVIDAPAVTWTIACLITAIGIVPSASAEQARQLAIDAGWMPVHLMLPEDVDNAVLLRVQTLTGQSRTIPVSDSDVWSRAVVARLGPASGVIARNLAAVVARRYCSSGELMMLRASIWAGQAEKQRMLDFECSPDGEPVGTR